MKMYYFIPLAFFRFCYSLRCPHMKESESPPSPPSPPYIYILLLQANPPTRNSVGIYQ